PPPSVCYAVVALLVALGWRVVVVVCAGVVDRGPPAAAIGRDALIDNLMTYWINGNGASSARIYWESFGKNAPLEVGDVPTGFATFPAEIIPPVRSWVEPMYPGLCHWAEYDKGGHFAAFEVPELFVSEIRDFARPLR
ncbi:MAG: hypothetical protein AB8G26_19440, partial [Ilumatobacter sp.]